MTAPLFSAYAQGNEGWLRPAVSALGIALAGLGCLFIADGIDANNALTLLTMGIGTWALALGVGLVRPGRAVFVLLAIAAVLLCLAVMTRAIGNSCGCYPVDDSQFSVVCV
ncbi:hypothetical protein P2318_02145 [Myxococcaceae bacterium GXIMD 01537]